jgi:nitroimidazol reductase NimA-like FMN-containing flavoprotein (pyridoxamine 5'-phosphate oxidase superfamily)
VNFGYDGESLYFHCAPSGTKIEYLAANPRVCFEFEHGVRLVPDEGRACSWSTDYHSVIGYGIASEVKGYDAKRRALQLVMRHYSDREWRLDGAELERVRVWRIRIDKVSGKRSGPPEAGPPRPP